MKQKKDNILKFFGIALILVCLLSLFIFSYAIFKINVVPVKYLFIGYGIVIFVLFFLGIIILGKKNKIIKGIAVFLLLVLSFFFLFATTYLDSTYQFFRSTQVKNYGVLQYSVVVLKENHYSDINKLENKMISYLNDEYKNQIASFLEEKISYSEDISNDYGTMVSNLLEKRIDAVCLEEGYLQLVSEEIPNFQKNIEIIYTFEVALGANISEESSEFIGDPFLLYISGIDSYGNVNQVRGRSDVNQIAVVNPKTKHILLVNTPRDYYVQLAGTTGLKDKLTHAGIYGISKSIATLQNLYAVNIDYYLRVNFDSLIKCVDVIGGIDIYSDASFTCFTNRSVHVEKGWNHFNGVEALAYSRERYAYQTGDHHRGQNQQQVITAILNKISQSSVLIQKYHRILNVMDGSFQTNMPMDMILSFIKRQLSDMSVWNIESIAVGGVGSKNYTYSMGMNHLLYVMEPDMNSVNKAKQRIKEVYQEQ